jgi:hypothetical protein
MTSQVEDLLELAIRAVSDVRKDKSYPGAQMICARLVELKSSARIELVATGSAGTLSRAVIDSWPLGSAATEAVVAAESSYWAWRAKACQ